MKLVTKMRRRKHLQMRWGTVELLGETSMTIEHWSGRISVAGHEFDCEREKRRGKGSAAGFIGERGRDRKGNRRGVNLPGSPWVLKGAPSVGHGVRVEGTRRSGCRAGHASGPPMAQGHNGVRVKKEKRNHFHFLFFYKLAPNSN